MTTLWKAGVFAAVTSVAQATPARAQNWTSAPLRNLGSQPTRGLCIRAVGAWDGAPVQLDQCPEGNVLPADKNLWYQHIQNIGTANGTLLLRVSNNGGGTDGSGDGTGMCLDNTNASRTDGTPVQVFSCYSQASNQYWSWTNADSFGDQMLRNYHTGMCLDLRSGWPFVGNVIQLFHCAPTVFPQGTHNYAQFWAWK